MTTSVTEMQAKLTDILKAHIGDLKIVADTPEKFEVAGTIETMQGKKKVDGIYFSTILPKPKDVRFYFFPAYTHKEQIGELPEPLKKCLKGKSCFHIKKLDDELEGQIKDLVQKSIKLYKKDGLL